MRDPYSRRKVGRKSPWIWSPRFDQSVVGRLVARARKVGADKTTRQRRTQRQRQDPRIRVVQVLMMRFRKDKNDGASIVAGANRMKKEHPERWTKRRAPLVNEKCWFLPSGWKTQDRWLTGRVVCYHKQDLPNKKEEFVFVETEAGKCFCVPTTQAWHRD